MRVFSRVALVVTLLLSGSAVMADHWIGECPLSLVDSTPAVTDFDPNDRVVFQPGRS